MYLSAPVLAAQYKPVNHELFYCSSVGYANHSDLALFIPCLIIQESAQKGMGQWEISASKATIIHSE